MENGNNGKRYYWLKLHDDFFAGLPIKKLRRMKNGDTLTLIYMKMLLKAIKSGGALAFSGLEPDLAAELALDLDEDAEDVRRTLEFMLSVGLAESAGGGCYLPAAVQFTGSEVVSAQRVREHRAKTKALQCNTNVTPLKRVCNTEKDKEKKTEEETEKEERERAFTGEETSPLSARLPAVRAAKRRLGEYANVLLTEAELERLKAEFPSDWRARIDALSAYIASTGRAYKSHYATVRNWARMEKERGPTSPAGRRDGDNVFLAIAREEGII